MAVTFEELTGSPEVRIVDGRFHATRRFKVAWSDTIAFTVDLMGGYSAIGDSFYYTAPAAFPGVPQAICREVDIRPFPEDWIDTGAGATLSDATNQPLYAVVRAGYRIADHANHRQRRKGLPLVPEGTYLSYAADIGMQTVSLPSRGFVWQDNGAPLPANQHLGLQVPSEQFQLRWERVPVALVPWARVRQLSGTVNELDFLEHPAETVLFQGAKTTYEFQFSGDVLVTLEMRFSVKEQASVSDPELRFGWNHWFRPEPAAGENWVRVVTGDGGVPPYRPADWSNLFGFAL